MNRMLTIAAVMLALTSWLAADTANAARVGGGRSMGAQRQMTPSTPHATPSAPTNPAAPSAVPRTATPATPAAAPSGMSRWLGPIAGIAAGLGLAALLSHFGLSESFASFLLIALVVVGGIMLVRFFLARRRAPAPLQYAGASATRIEPQMGRTTSALEPVMASAGGSAPAASRFPPGFDATVFAEQAKQQFRRLQAAYDNGDRNALADVMTPEMLGEVSKDLLQRTSHQATVVDHLDAEVIDVATEGKEHWMSVRFTGQLREDGAMLAKPFEETWNLVKPVDGSSGWMLAGIQQAHEMA